VFFRLGNADCLTVGVGLQVADECLHLGYSPSLRLRVTQECPGQFEPARPRRVVSGAFRVGEQVLGGVSPLSSSCRSSASLGEPATRPETARTSAETRIIMMPRVGQRGWRALFQEYPLIRGRYGSQRRAPTPLPFRAVAQTQARLPCTQVRERGFRSAQPTPVVFDRAGYRGLEFAQLC
jgi:hypothetical protein